MANAISPTLSFQHFYTKQTTSSSYSLWKQNQKKMMNRSSTRLPPVYSIRCYMENSNSISGFANKVIGALPLVGLLARILSDEGGVGNDIIDFAEFRRRVGNKCTVTDSRAFYDFQERRGKAGEPLYVLMCCWLPAVGAGLLKSEEILEGVARLRISDDIEFEEQEFLAVMNDAREASQSFFIILSLPTLSYGVNTNYI